MSDIKLVRAAIHHQHNGHIDIRVTHRERWVIGILLIQIVVTRSPT